MQFHNQITNQTVSSLPWQEQLKTGDYYVIENLWIGVQFPALTDDYPVYGQILDTRKNCEPGFFNVRAFSVMYPNGLVEHMCIMEVTRVISRQEFDAARRNGWSSMP